MKDNTVKNDKGYTIDVYDDDIFSMADDYIDHMLNAPEDIHKKQCFAGMIIAIYLVLPDLT